MATTAPCYVLKGRCASRTEYTPKHYSLDNTTDATSASENAITGVNVTAKAENKTPNAPNLRCKLAEPAKVGFAIGNSSFNDASGLMLSRAEAVQTLLPI